MAMVIRFTGECKLFMNFESKDPLNFLFVFIFALSLLNLHLNPISASYLSEEFSVQFFMLSASEFIFDRNQ